MTTYSKIKLILIPLIFLVAFTACNSNKKTDTTRDIQLLPDSSAYHNNASTDSAKMRAANITPAAPVRNTAPAEEHHHTSSSTHRSVSHTSSSTASSGTVSNSGTVAHSGTSTSASQGTTKKKGWSKAAQGAVIGGAAGAVGGAIISKHKGTGAAIGAAIGAAGGYIIGRNKDKKDGR